MAKQATSKKATAKRTTAKKSVKKTTTNKPAVTAKKTSVKKSKAAIDPTFNPNGVTFLVSTAAVMILFTLALIITM